MDGGEHITSEAMTNKHSDLLWAIHRDDPRLSSIPALAGGGRVSREYAPSQMYTGGASNQPVNLVAIVENPWTGEQVQAVVKQVATVTADQRIQAETSRVAHHRNGKR